MSMNEYTGDQLLAAVKTGKRKPDQFFEAVTEIDRRVANRNAKGKLPTPPVAEALAILARRGIDHIESTVEAPAPTVEADEPVAPKATPKAKAEKAPLTAEQKARRAADRKAKKVAEKLAAENGGQGFMRFYIKARSEAFKAL